jgi:hypothetical protein
VTWGFLWLMLALKLPLAALIYIVWWAIKQEPEQPSSSEDGGSAVKPPRPHPRKPLPRRPRRGPHGDPAPNPPARVRSVRARGRRVGHDSN